MKRIEFIETAMTMMGATLATYAPANGKNFFAKKRIAMVGTGHSRNQILANRSNRRAY